MSKIKDRYFDFINSSDYHQYYLTESSPINHQNDLQEEKTVGLKQDSQSIKKRLEMRFKRSEGK